MSYTRQTIQNRYKNLEKIISTVNLCQIKRIKKWISSAGTLVIYCVFYKQILIVYKKGFILVNLLLIYIFTKAFVSFLGIQYFGVYKIKIGKIISDFFLGLTLTVFTINLICSTSKEIVALKFWSLLPFYSEIVNFIVCRPSYDTLKNIIEFIPISLGYTAKNWISVSFVRFHSKIFFERKLTKLDEKILHQLSAEKDLIEMGDSIYEVQQSYIFLGEKILRNLEIRLFPFKIIFIYTFFSCISGTSGMLSSIAFLLIFQEINKNAIEKRHPKI